MLSDDEFIVSGEDPGGLSLVFSDRRPDNRSVPFEAFVAGVIGTGFSARVRVCDWGESYNPAAYFSNLAEQWKGWDGEMTWESLEGELILRASQDRSGHVMIIVDLNRGRDDLPFSARATIETTAGQLERLSREAASFFGP